MRIGVPRTLRWQFPLLLVAMGLLVVAGGLTAVVALLRTSDEAARLATERAAYNEDARRLLQLTHAIEISAMQALSEPTKANEMLLYEGLVRNLDELDRLTNRLAQGDDVAMLDLYQTSQMFRSAVQVLAPWVHQTTSPTRSAPPVQERGQISAEQAQDLRTRAARLVAAAQVQSDLFTNAYQAAVDRAVSSSRRSAVWVAALLLASLSAAAIIGYWLIGRRLVARLQVVSRYLRNYEDSPEGSVLVPVDGRDEIAEMARAVEQCLDDRRQLVRARASLEDSRQRLAAVIDHLAEAVVVLQNGRVEQVNGAAERLFGLTQAQAVGLELCALIHGGIDSAATWDKPFETLAWRTDGCSIPVEVSMSEVRREQAVLIVLVVRDASPHKEAERNLLAARDAAEAARVAQANVLRTMSHELRTPLNAVLGYAQLLLGDETLNERQRRRLETIEGSGRHLLGLINDALDLAKQEAGRLTLVIEEASPVHILAVVSDMIRVKADEKGLVFRLDVSPELPLRAMLDERRLKQVLLNLLGNAVKFTDQGEVLLRVTLGTPRSEGRAIVRFEVCDTGEGLPPDQLEAIFRPFEQKGDVRRRAVGTGLGLAISRQLVRLMGGDIHVTSELGRGSRFWFEIEVLQVSGAAPAQDVNVPDVARAASWPSVVKTLDGGTLPAPGSSHTH